MLVRVVAGGRTPLYPGKRSGHSTVTRTILVKRTPAAVSTLGTFLAGGSIKARKKVAGGVS